MKRFPLLVILSVLLSCEKRVEFEQEGILTGPDMAYCACCGGIILEMGTNTQYRVDSLKGMSFQELVNLKFPVHIRYHAAVKNECGDFQHLVINDYRLVN